MAKTRQTLAAISQRRDARGIASPDGMAGYLEAVLGEACDALAACARQPLLAAEVRDAVRSLAEAVARLRGQVGWAMRDPAGLPGRGDALPAMTRAMLRDLERATLCGAFRERCGELASRLADPDRARAAVVELRTGLTVLCRAFGLPPSN